MADAAGGARDPRALEQPLGVDDGVISLAAQFVQETAYLGSHPSLPWLPPPAPHGGGQYPRHLRMQPRNCGKGLCDHPVDGHPRHRGNQIADHR